LYAYADASCTKDGKLRVEANIPLRLLGNVDGKIATIDSKRLLEPLRLAARDALDYVGNRSSGASVNVSCEIPVGAGLGSSAATTVAIIAAVSQASGTRLEKKEIFKIAFGPESYLHGKPSGVDQATCTYGGIIRFSKPDKVKELRLKTIPRLVVCDTGIHRSTRGLVGAVVRRSKVHSKLFHGHVKEVSQISESAARALKEGNDEELGALMNRNQELLEQIGVSHPKLNHFVNIARRNGALGAKLTGAGGGGCMVALCEGESGMIRVAKVLRRQGGTPYKISLDRSGVRSEANGTGLK
jgi:mevalonate kinase